MMASPTLQERLEQWTGRASNILLRVGATSPSSTSLGISAFTSRTRETLALRQRIFNKRVAIMALPASILCKIILQLATGDAIALSQTCHHLRCLVIQTSEVWGILDFDLPTGSLNLERSLIGRSGKAPLQLAFSVPHDTSPALTWTKTYCEILDENIHRITKLAISSSGDIFVPADDDLPLHSGAHGALQCTLMAQALAKPARMLKRFMLSPDHLPLQNLPLDLFSGDAPVLEFCLLQAVSLLPGSYAALSNLTTLHYHASTWRRAASSFSIDVAQMLMAMPKLVNLCLDGQTLSLPAVSPAGDLKGGCLRNVRLHNVKGVSFSEMYPFFKSAGARHFSYNPRRPALWNVATAGIDAEQPLKHCSCITSMTVGTWHIELVDHGGADDEPTTLRTPSSLRIAPFILSEPLAFAHLTQLTIGEFCWPETKMPDAPHLSTLRIVLGACIDHRVSTQYHGVPGVFFSSAAEWTCVSLRTIQFAYQPPTSGAVTCETMGRTLGRGTRGFCCRKGPLAISLYEVRRFILTSLNFGDGRLACLKLTGVEPRDTDTSVELLCELAEKVVITSSVDATVTLRDDWEPCRNAFHRHDVSS